MKKKLFTKISKLKNHCIVGCKWLFKCKIDANGQMEHYKTNLVAQGFSQVEDINYNEIYDS